MTLGAVCCHVIEAAKSHPRPLHGFHGLGTKGFSVCNSAAWTCCGHNLATDHSVRAIRCEWVADTGRRRRHIFVLALAMAAAEGGSDATGVDG